MQFNVPQFIELEDKILGPLTFRQFFLLIAAGLFLIFIWYSFQFWFFLAVAIPTVILVLALVFVKINGRSFFSFLNSWISYWLKPRLYVWRKK